MKTRLAAIFILIACLTTCLFAPPAFAQDAPPATADRVAARPVPPPTRESLVAFWEETAAQDPRVKKLEKTKEEGVYLFETDFFPYKGRLKIVNAVVTGDDSQYYQNLSRGIIEAELMDAGEDFFRKYARSYGAWTQGLNFYYNQKRGVWFSPKDWEAHARDFDRYAAGQETFVTSGRGCPYTAFFTRYGGSLLYLLVFLGAVLILLLFARKQNRRIWDNHATALAEQQRGLKMVEESQKIAQESLKFQQEQARLLQEILAALKK